MKSTEYIGRRMSRPNAKALLRGQGKYVDDISLPGMLHVFFIRNPYGHALIGEINKEEALKMPGAVAVVDGAEMLEYCEPWRAELTHLSPMNTVLQYALPPERSCYQGEPVVAVVAESRALAEDAAELVVIDWQELPPVASLEVAQKEGGPYVHPESGSNLAWEFGIDEGDIDRVFEDAEVVVQQDFYVDRQTGVTLEPRGIIASHNSADSRLTLYHSTQVPHIQRAVYARQLGLKENRLRIICPDLGGGFGLKLHVYNDEIATAALSMMLGRPVKFIADRLESFLSDIHARGHSIEAM